VAVSRDGRVLVADTGNHVIRAVGVDGVITTAAGSTSGDAGDDVEAAAARFKQPFGLAVGRDGTVFIADTGNHKVRRLGTGLWISYLAGVISGLLGVGGGPIKVPVMYLVMGVPLKVATATSNFMIGVTAAASAYIYYVRGNIQVNPTAPVVVGVFMGSLLGSHVSRWVPTRWILWLFVLVMYYLAVSMGWKALKGA
jgi:uncharacterized membrane protein YfcA